MRWLSLGCQTEGWVAAPNQKEAMMTDRSYVEKAAAAGAGKIGLLQEDPLRYMLRAVGQGTAR